MPSMHSPFRLLRTGVIGSTVLGLAAGAHLLAGGSLPAPAIMVALLALHVLCSTVATRFQLTLPAMLALLATSQLVLHQAFELLSLPISPIPATAGASLHNHALSAQDQSAAVLESLTTAGTGTTAMGMMGHGGASGWMLFGHLCATVATALVLARGENALWSLAAWLRPLFHRAAVVLHVPAVPGTPAIAPLPLPQLPWRNIRPDTRRGPPHLSAIFA